MGNAVQRNRLRRRLREIVRERTVGGWDFVVIARAGAAEASYQDLSDAFQDLMGRARLSPPGR